ncbi:MAG: PQQ-binding-like beta-propeller repeat protein [Gemmataceae bacterium]
MMEQKRRGLGMLSLGAACLAAFALVVVAMKLQISSNRYVSTGDLLAELADSEILDDPTPAARSWPQWMGPTRNGLVSMPELPRRWSGRGPRVHWRKTSDETYASMAVDQGRVFTLLAEEGRESVVCWDLASGEERWKHPFEPGQTFQYGGPRATPALAAGRVYGFSQAGVLVCLEASNGQLVWSRDLVKELGAVPGRWGFACSPLVEEGKVYICLGGKAGRCLAALDASDGATVWTTEDDPVGYSSPMATTLGGVRQVLFFTGRRLLGVSRDEGKLLWEYPWPTEFEVNAATPVVIRTRNAGGEGVYVFISSGYGKGCALIKVEVREGSQCFRARRVYESDALCCHFSTPVRRGAYLYGLDEKRDLTCLDLRTGEAVWRFSRDEDAEGLRGVGYKKGSLVRVDDLLLVLGEDGKLALVEATPDAYRELTAIRPFRERCWTLPVLAEGRLLIRDWKRVQCLDLRP